MHNVNRKSTPAVRGGRVQKKNDWTRTPNYFNTPQRWPVIDRQRPGAGYRHFLLRRDVEKFIGLLPDWNELSVGLNAIVLAPGEYSTGGWHLPGVVAVCAWDADLWVDYRWDFYEDHKPIFNRLGVPAEPIENGYLCQFTEDTARAYQLLYILTHELGHHHDRMTTHSKRCASRGESYAEQYALRYEKQIWARYVEAFGGF